MKKHRRKPGRLQRPPDPDRRARLVRRTVCGARATELRRRHLPASPIAMFDRWYRQAFAAKAAQPDAMTLATATPGGVPSARVVALRGHDRRGFAFYTDRRSRKGRELRVNRRAALVFYWPLLGRQVRISGLITGLTEVESRRYFATRPPRSRLAAWASRQGSPIRDRAVLDARFARRREQFSNVEIPLPRYWGGFRLAPRTIEFWQSHPDRLHDRFLYKRLASGRWRIERLSP